MSQLRAPTARPERREGGRHGRPGGRSQSAAGRPRAGQPAPEVPLRRQLLRTAVLPAVAAALSGAAAVLFAVRASGVRPSGSLLAALGGSGALAVAAVAAAFLGAHRVSAGVLDRSLALRRTQAEQQTELRAVVERLRGGDPVTSPCPAPPTAPTADAFDLLAQEMGRAHEGAVAAVVEASQLFSRTGNEQKVEVFVNLARRLQSLVHREIQILDELEHEVEDPDLLKGLFHVDHLATRIRRHAENLAVLGGAVSRRQWSNPVSMTEVLRSAVAEVEYYPRVKLVPPVDGTLRGHAVADVIHLLAELVENATVFSAPHTQVLLRAQRVTAGLALEVEDRGLGMPAPEQQRMNTLLADPDQVNVAHLLQDGRIGLFVVASLARRHGIAVRLQSNIYGGTQAVLVLPQVLLGIDCDTQEVPGAAAAGPTGTTPRNTGAVPRYPDRAVAPPTPPSPAEAPPSPDRAGPVLSRPAPVPAPQSPPSPTVQPTLRPDRMPRQTPRGEEAPPPRHERTDAPSHAAPPTGARPVPHTAPPPGARSVPHTAPPPGGDDPSAPQGAPGRPQLPRRSNQEHLVPQLREAPAPRTEGTDILHDPGLMAAFRRGVDLADAQTPEDPEPTGHAAGPQAPGPAVAVGGRPAGHGLAPLPVRGHTASDSGALPDPGDGGPRVTGTGSGGPQMTGAGYGGPGAAESGYGGPLSPQAGPRTENTFKE
ncbi:MULTISPECIES: ATP-binding protein [unclassified Streptomyces]|uniref:ATP-binding protein n=1 Tax=unclassified Streptomyces TaxID=2593676 RepID=UPI00048D807E|nr:MULTISPECIES: ATP-binding protein [unclassified Streptomyces]MYY16531.1 ATP-binding protein [Streptomyces sp. SID4912]SCD85541.1 Signal transduction histidine kinase [Streptomyces sp. DpondAA-D4]